MNRVRSPLLATLLARDLAWSDVEVNSASLEGEDGRPALPEAVRLAASFGVDLTGHSSRALTSVDVDSATVVLTMTEDQRAQVADLAPRRSARAFTVREFARLLNYPVTGRGLEGVVAELDRSRGSHVKPTMPEDVQDPTGMSSEVFTAVGDDLLRLSRHIARRLRAAF